LYFLKELKKIQQRAAIWIIKAFCTSSTQEIEVIAGLIPIYLYLCKISRWQQLRTVSLPSNHAINSLLEKHHSKNMLSYCLSLEALTFKQCFKVKSFIVNVNNYLNEIFLSFNPLHKELLSRFRLVDNFSDCFFFIQ